MCLLITCLVAPVLSPHLLSYNEGLDGVAVQIQAIDSLTGPAKLGTMKGK
jgi:hypothetical protein